MNFSLHYSIGKIQDPKICPIVESFGGRGSTTVKADDKNILKEHFGHFENLFAPIIIFPKKF